MKEERRKCRENEKRRRKEKNQEKRVKAEDCMEKHSTFGNSKVNYNMSSQTFCPLLSKFQFLPHFTDTQLPATGKWQYFAPYPLSRSLHSPFLLLACLSFAFYIDIYDIAWNLGYIPMSKLNIHGDKLFNNTIGYVLHA